MKRAATLQPLPRSGIFIDPNYFIWGGSVYRDQDGTCHMYYSRWPRSMGMHAWTTNSEVAHAVASGPHGPFRHVDVALPRRGAEYWDGLCTHNPTVHKFGDKLYLYYTGNTGDDVSPTDGLNWVHRNNQRIGVAVSDSPEGPWRRMDAPVIPTSSDVGAPDHLCVANPAVTSRPTGGYLMVYKAVAAQNPLPFGGPVTHLAATAKYPTGPFEKNLTPIFTFPGHNFPAEDPYIWHDGDAYLAVVKDFDGSFTGSGRSLAVFRSPDGFDWAPAGNTLLSSTEIVDKDGAPMRLHRLERPQLLVEDGKPLVLYCAASPDTSESHSFNVHIPIQDWAP